MTHYVIYIMIPVCFIVSSSLFASSSTGSTKMERFREAADLSWEEAFTGPGTRNWQERWHLDGQNADVSMTDQGMVFKAGGPEVTDANMAVLWTRKSFEGDVRISYDYTRLDNADHYVTILYILATGKGYGGSPEDIMKWADRREVPAMNKYFENMNLLHISYAAMPTPSQIARTGDKREYIRVRRYPIPPGGRFDDIIVPPDYYETGLWKTGKTYHVDVIKRGPYLNMKVTPPDGDPQYFRWDTSGWPPIQEGRIGLRHMATREARYDNFTVYTLSEDAPPVEDRWRQITSVEETVNAYPDEMRSLMNALDLTRPGLEGVRKQWEAGNLTDACKALLSYYREADTASWWRNPEIDPGGEASERARELLKDIYQGHDGPGKVPRTADGHLAWGSSGPRHDQGFRSSLNRQPHLGTLMRAYLDTGERKYLKRVDQDIRDWLTAADGRVTPWARSVLDPGIRITHWAEVFMKLQGESDFTPATRLLMLAAIPDHAERLLEEPGGGNWISMTQRGVLTAAIAWPEFEKAEQWEQQAMDNFVDNARSTVYPDGAQKELTAAYHMVPCKRFERTIRLLEKAGRDVPQEFREITRSMWDYIAYALRPDGTRPMNNDSGLASHADRLLRMADRYSRPDWRYIASNGKNGERPEDPPSRFFPWAGQMIGRSGWDADAQWYFFDIGPWGLGHQHNDHGQLSITSGGRHLLVDVGRFAYSGPLADQFRAPYALHTRGHNTIMIDGGGQNDYEETTDHQHPIATTKKDYDFALGTFDSGYESDKATPASHTRAVLYTRGHGWIVVDRIQCSGKRTISPLWHFHPDCTVETVDEIMRTADADKENLRLAPVGSLDWQTEIIEGREEPEPQGWYSENYGEAEPAPVAKYETQITGDTTFAWAITTGSDQPPAPEVKSLEAPEGIARMKVTWPDATTRTVTVVMDETVLPYELPNGQTLVGRLLIQQSGQDPEVGAGWLLDQDGAVVAADPMAADAALEDLADSVPVTTSRTAPHTHEVQIPLVNARFNGPLEVSVSPAPDSGNGWQIKGSPAECTLKLGESETLRLELRCDPHKPRYPLPELEAELELPNHGNDKQTLRLKKRISLGLVGSQPPVTIRKTETAPSIDGALSDKVWEGPVDIAVLGRMDRKRDVSPTTEVRLRYDEDALYAAFRCDEPHPEKLKSAAEERDGNVYQDDSVEIMLDANGDEKTYYQVIASVKGVIYDGKNFDNSVDIENLKVATQTEEDAWTAEIAIPWQGVGLEGPPEEAGILFARNRQVSGEHEVFQFPVSPDGNHQPGFFAELFPLKDNDQ